MKKILLIEDNTELRESLAEILEISDYKVVAAENGKVGVQKALQEIPDLILCDTLSDFREEGLIDLQDGGIVILNSRKLAEMPD